MSDLPAARYDPHRRRRTVLVAIIGVALLFVLASCPVGAFAIQQRMIAPPAFAFSIAGVEFAAPCPRHKFICDDTMGWYAIWRGDREPDGTMTYRQLFFLYLKKPRQ